VRTEGVKSWAGLWVREDGDGGAIEFDNIQDRPLRGTTGWKEVVIQLPLHAECQRVVFGALLAGEGKVWVDDLRLFVDGKALCDVPKIVRAKTAKP